MKQLLHITLLLAGLLLLIASVACANIIGTIAGSAIMLIGARLESKTEVTL